MNTPSWSKKARRHRSHSERRRRPARSRRAFIEALEDRRLLAVITVDNLDAGLANDGSVSLAEAVLGTGSGLKVEKQVSEGREERVSSSRSSGSLRDSLESLS